jgi:hypothetical protein
MRNFISFMIILFVFNSCSDNLPIKESDLNKYPWLTIFLIGELDDFEGIHNIDVGTIQFSYLNKTMNKDNILMTIDSVAKNQTWTLVNSSINGREYSKSLNQYNIDTEETIIKIEIDSLESRICYTIN